MPSKDIEARRAASRAHYAANKEAYKQRAREWTVKQRVLLRQRIADAKAVPCADCGGRWPTPVMEFDHVSDDKDCNVADMVQRGVSLAKLNAEIVKCEIVCANCHRLRTMQRGDVAAD